MDDLQKKIMRDNPKLFPPHDDNSIGGIIFSPNFSIWDKICIFAMSIMLVAASLGFTFLALLIFG